MPNTPLPDSRSPLLTLPITRRQSLGAGLATLLAGAVPWPVAAAAGAASFPLGRAIGFRPVPMTVTEPLAVPPGYTARVLLVLSSPGWPWL